MMYYVRRQGRLGVRICNCVNTGHRSWQRRARSGGDVMFDSGAFDLGVRAV